ncbi:MAG: exo-alpha-sialidase [Candidatus Coatesbacteria bacterium]|nr:MAG: exo-alpha-sialidase [Candidatus Coatesbacteria bacterium]
MIIRAKVVEYSNLMENTLRDWVMGLLIVLTGGAAAEAAFAEWSPPETITPPEGKWRTCYNSAGAVASDGRGNLHVVFFEEAGTAAYYRRFDGAAGRWEAPLRLDEATGRDAALVAAADGRLHIFFKSGRALCHRVGEPIGTWGPPEYIKIPNRTPALPAPLALPTGDVAVAMVAERAHRPPAEIWYTVWRTEEGTFDPPVRLSEEPANLGGWTPTVALFRGELHVVWRDDRSGEFDLYESVFDGSTWTGPFRLTSDPASTFHPRLVVDGNDTLRLFFMDRRGGRAAIWEKEWDGERWTADRLLFDGGGEAYHPTTARTPDGRLLLFWEDTRETPAAEIFYAAFSEGAWTEPRRISRSPGVASGCASAAVTPSGEIAVVYTEGGRVRVQTLAAGATD